MVDIVGIGIVNDIANEGIDMKVMNVENAGTVTEYHRLFRQICVAIAALSFGSPCP